LTKTSRKSKLTEINKPEERNSSVFTTLQAKEVWDSIPEISRRFSEELLADSAVLNFSLHELKTALEME